MASNIPVIVQGNSFSLAIPLQIYYINGDQMDLQNYTPDPTDEVSVQLKGSRRNYTYTPTIDGNVANIDLSGNELADNYSVVVSIVKANGQRLRSFRTDQFFIVESSDDLTMDDIVEGLEENVIYLNSSIFVAGEDGRGIESIVKTATAGLVDTYTITYTDNTASTFNVTNGAQGDDGVGITTIEKTSTAGLVDTYTITLSNGNTSTFDVTNGKDGVDLGLATIVNDLTTGGATNVLSAEMGKDLGMLTDRASALGIQYPALLKSLPSGYTALDYIGSTGAVLDTGIVPSDAKWRFVGSWKRTGAASSNADIIAAAGSTVSYSAYRIRRNGSSDSSVLVVAYTKANAPTQVSLTDSGTVWHNYDLQNGKITLDGVDTTLSGVAKGTLSATMKLGSTGYPQQIGRFVALHDDVLVAAFQPCKDSNDVYGMYDLVGGQFYGSANANNFTGGNEELPESDKVVDAEVLSKLLSPLQITTNTLTKDVELLPVGSRLNSDTTIATSSAGNFSRTTPTVTLSRASDGVGLKVEYGTAVASGIEYAGLFANYSVGDKFCITFEARRTSKVLTSIDGFLNEDYINDFTPAFSCELGDGWQKFVFTDIPIGNGSQNGKFSINISKHITAPNSAFEIRNLSILLASSVTEIELEGEELQNNVTDNILRGKKVSIMGDSISTFEDADNGVYNAREFTVLASDISNNRTLQGYPTYYDIGTTIGGVTVDAAMVGVLTSFTPVSGDEGKSIGKPLNRNSTTLYNVVDIWWHRLADALGGTILQNVSWSGASMCSHEGNANELKTSYAWHDAQINKLATRDADGNAINPDVVIIYRGTNDMTHSPYAKLTDYGAGSMTVPSDDAVTDGYGFKEAYVKTIEKIRAKYPNAFIICCTLNVFKRLGVSDFPMNNGINTLPEYNNAIREIADMMGCGLIEFDKDGITMENCYPTFINDSSTDPTHPNPRGHRMMALKAIADVQKM